jgi:hypothetical protein
MYTYVHSVSIGNTTVTIPPPVEGEVHIQTSSGNHGSVPTIKIVGLRVYIHYTLKKIPTKIYYF